MHNIYIASSWRSTKQPGVINYLRKQEFEVYDFRTNDFQWKDIDPNWEQWRDEEYLVALQHPLARKQFKSDMDALYDADAVVLVLPCGASAHLELGYAVGMGKHTAILLDDDRAELMYGMVDYMTHDVVELAQWLNRGTD